MKRQYKKFENSLVSRVVAAVSERGEATIDDLGPDFPDISRKQLHAALANGRDARLIRVKVRGFRGGPQSVWEMGTHKVASPFPQPEQLTAVPSVFALSNPILCDHEWPPLPVGRVIEKLGAWNETEAEAV